MPPEADPVFKGGADATLLLLAQEAAAKAKEEKKEPPKRGRVFTALLRLLGAGADRDVPISDQGKEWSVRVGNSDNFASLEGQPVILDPVRGITALVGTTHAGEQEVLELRFAKEKEWTLETVRSFLAQQGIDRQNDQGLSVGVDRFHAEYASDQRVVRETADYWIIPGTVLTREGVMNGGLKPWADVRRMARLWDGVPITYPHPADLVGPDDLDIIGGQVRDVEVDEKKRRVVGSQYLAKHSVPGLEVSDKARQWNEETVRRFQAGERLGNSVGFVYRKERVAGDHQGKKFSHVQRAIVPNHLANLGIGENKDAPACTWDDGCGPGRAQEQTQDQLRNQPPGDGTMADDKKECGSDCQARSNELRQHQDAARELAGVLAMKDAAPAQLVAGVKERLTRLEKLEAEEKNRHGVLAAEVAQLEKDLGADVDVKEHAKKLASDFGDAALVHHKATLEKALEFATRGNGKASRRDGSLIGGEKGRDERRGVASMDRVWPEKKGGVA